jgi:hypothetical protein
MNRKAKKRKPTVAQLRKLKLDESSDQRPSNLYDSAWDQPSQTLQDAVRTHRGSYGFRGDKNAPTLRQQRLDEWNKMRGEMIDEARRREASGEKDEIFGAKYAAIPSPMKKSNE